MVIGAGAVGVEFADVYAAYGAQVTLLEALPRVLPIEDEEVSAQLIARLFASPRHHDQDRRQGLGREAGRRRALIVETDGGRLEAEQVLMAVGRAART